MASSDYLTIPALSNDQITKFFAKVSIDPVTGCWNWTGYTTANGYGQVRINKVLYITHRLIYALCVGPVPKRKGKDIPVIDHICRNRSCCNPNHLRLLSDKENILIGNGATARKARRTHCKNGHLLPPPINGHRRCMICHRAWNRANYAKTPDKFRTKVNERRARLHNKA